MAIGPENVRPKGLAPEGDLVPPATAIVVGAEASVAAATEVPQHA